jgi:glycosyltransferase involved in cell wall biosynthesis
VIRKPFSIALDATYSLDRSPSGVALYSREILNGLARAHPESRFGFYYRPHRFLRSFSAETPPNVARHLLLSGAVCDLFHGLNQRLPRFTTGRSVVTFHDLFVLTGEYSSAEFRARFAEQARDAAARADFIITVSDFTRRQVISFLRADPAKVRVVHHGTRPLPFPQNVARERVILSAGAIQKRKNIARLVEAFEAVDSSWRLVLIGSDGYGSEEIRARIESSPARARIVLPGYVTPESLAHWYARASIFAFPSLDEGFGMPLLEAMSAGVPILTSNRSALPEVAGDAALLADPNDVNSLVTALRRLTTDESLRADLAARGLARCKEFTWEKAVAETWDVYRQLL